MSERAGRTPVMIPDEAVEAAAKASYEAGAYCGECYYEGWGECSVCQSLNMGYARAALEAAAPHIAANVLEDAADAYVSENPMRWTSHEIAWLRARATELRSQS